MTPKRNSITHYGKPLVSIILALAAVFGLYIATWGASDKILISILYVHWVTIFYLIWLSWDFRAAAFSAPDVKSVKIAEGILIVGHRDWLGVSVSVLIFKQESDYERLLCPGRVINVQRNGLIQIALDLTIIDDADLETIKGRISDGNLASIIIKPGTA
jgi:hypothetical protein